MRFSEGFHSSLEVQTIKAEYIRSNENWLFCAMEIECVGAQGYNPLRGPPTRIHTHTHCVTSVEIHNALKTVAVG